MIKNNTSITYIATLILCSTVLLFSSVVNSKELDNINHKGIELFDNHQYQAAENYFIEQLSLLSEQNDHKQDYKQALVYLSKIYLGKRDSEQAVEYIEEALEITPVTAEQLLLAGDIYCKHARAVSIFSALGLGKKCIKQYEQAIKLFPDNTKALYTAVQFHLYAPSLVGGSIEKAEAYLGKLELLSEESTRLLKVLHKEVTDDESSAQALAEKFAKTAYKSAEHQYQLAMFFREKKQYQLSKQLLNSIISNTDENKLLNNDLSWHQNDSWLQLGEIYLEEGKELAKSLDYIQGYLERNDDPFDPHYYWARWSYAKVHYEIGNIAQYKKIVTAIKKQDYQKDSDFKERFKEGLKQRKS